MNIEQLKKANELKEKLDYLNTKIQCLTIINEQATTCRSALGLNLEFVNVNKRLNHTRFGVSTAEMQHILKYTIACLEKQKNELELEFTQL